jgi:hypothetical protein
VSFSKQADEEKQSFFAAFSRAILRVIFTFSDVRGSGDGSKGKTKRRLVTSIRFCRMQERLQSLTENNLYTLLSFGCQAA